MTQLTLPSRVRHIKQGVLIQQGTWASVTTYATLKGACPIEPVIWMAEENYVVHHL